MEGDDQPTGAEFILTDLDGENLAGLAGGQGIHKRALREWPRITSTVGRFVTSIVVRDEGLPAPLGPEVLLFVPESAWPGAQRPPVLHMVRLATGRTSTLVVELLLPDHGAPRLTDARTFVLRAVLRELPFLERHLVLVDSPHDGLPVWAYERGKRRELDCMGLGSQREPGHDAPDWRSIPPGYLGFAGEPIVARFERTLLLGRSVLPGLGQEGELLAAWGAARIVTKSDRKKAIMRRDTWTKMEIG